MSCLTFLMFCPLMVPERPKSVAAMADQQILRKLEYFFLSYRRTHYDNKKNLTCNFPSLS